MTNSPARGPAILGGVLGGLALGAAGLAPLPRPFPELAAPALPDLPDVPLPEDLPTPVERFLRDVYGPRLPVVRSVVATGRARIRPFGFWLPARFRFTHQIGVGYRHYIEVTWYRRPVMRVNERYIDGSSLLEIPGIGMDSGPKVEQAANLGMWAELAAAAPAVLATSPRVRWEAVDANTALLFVPFGDTDEDHFEVRFDPATGRLASLSAARFRDSRSPEKILWTGHSLPGPTCGPHRLPAVGTATWADQGRPWARFTTEHIATNVDVAEYVRGRGI